MLRIKHTFPIATALLIAVAAWLLFGERQPAPDLAPLAPAETDYYVRDFTLLTSDDDGAWRYRLEAEHMLHFPATEHWEMEAPRIKVFTQEGPNWYGIADRGRAWDEGEHIRLDGAVRLWQAPTPTGTSLIVTSSDVRVRPVEDYADSDTYTVVTQGRDRMEGIGARIWFDRQQVELLSNVKAHLEP